MDRAALGEELLTLEGAIAIPMAEVQSKSLSSLLVQEQWTRLADDVASDVRRADSCRSSLLSLLKTLLTL